MSETQKSKVYWLQFVSIIACILSLVIFLYFLFYSGNVKNQALASSYSPEQILLAVNTERQKKDLKPLRPNEKLTKAAQNKAQDMSDKNYFSHISPVDGKKWSDFIKESDYSYHVAGENLANGFQDVPRMVESWMNSPSHKENILNKEVTDTGIGISFGKLGDIPTIFVVQDFGKEDISKSKKPSALSEEPPAFEVTSIASSLAGVEK